MNVIHQQKVPIIHSSYETHAIYKRFSHCQLSGLQSDAVVLLADGKVGSLFRDNQPDQAGDKPDQLPQRPAPARAGPQADVRVSGRHHPRQHRHHPGQRAGPGRGVQGLRRPPHPLDAGLQCRHHLRGHRVLVSHIRGKGGWLVCMMHLCCMKTVLWENNYSARQVSISTMLVVQSI